MKNNNGTFSLSFHFFCLLYKSLPFSTLPPFSHSLTVCLSLFTFFVFSLHLSYPLFSYFVYPSLCLGFASFSPLCLGYFYTFLSSSTILCLCLPSFSLCHFYYLPFSATLTLSFFLHYFCSYISFSLSLFLFFFPSLFLFFYPSLFLFFFPSLFLFFFTSLFLFFFPSLSFSFPLFFL